MKGKKWAIFLLLILVLWISCGITGVLAKDDEEIIEIKNVITDFSNAFFLRDIHSVMKYVSNKYFDSINIKELKNSLISEESKEELKKSVKEEFLLKKNDQSIEVFKKYLIQKHNFYFPDMVDFLRNLQSLRSTGSAHRNR